MTPTRWFKAFMKLDHQELIDQEEGMLWYVICGDPNWTGYFTEEDVSEDAGWEPKQVKELHAMKKGDCFRFYGDFGHTILCVKEK